MTTDILKERRGAVGVITLNRPDVRNALRPELMEQLRQAVTEFDDDPQVRVMVLTGAGKSFCAGADMDFMDVVMKMPPQDIKGVAYRSFQGATRALRLASKPVVAAVNGAAFGAGCEVAVACDFRIVATDTVFCENWVEMGAMPPLGGAFLLPRLVGLERASDMVLNAARVDGRRAVEIGLATQVVEPQALFDAALAYAGQLASKPAAAVVAIKQALRRGLEGQLAAEWEYYVNVQAMLLSAPEFAERVAQLKGRIRGQDTAGAKA
jgi:enoyl-CoA hydratase/carnithine racemase